MNEILQGFLTLPQVDHSFRLLIAVLCGAFLGMERSFRSKHAGLRTHAILAGGAALFMILSKYAFFDLAKGAGMQGFDPTVIACYIIDGSGFLGAGIIFNKVDQDTVSGLTTAAGIWATAAVGMACGSGLYWVAIFMAVLILGVQLLMHHFNVGYDAYSNGEIRMTLVDTPEIRAILKEKQQELGITIVSSRITTCADNTLNMILQVRMKQNIPFSAVLKFMDEHPEIKSLSI